jgi:catecholate siderophore receptor
VKLKLLPAAIRATFYSAGAFAGVMPAYATTDIAAAEPAAAESAADAAAATPTAPTASDEAASPDAVEMTPIEVEGQRDERYLTGRTRVGRQEQSPHDIPQSVSVVGEQLMLDRGAYSMREALRNVAGLTFNAGEGGRIGDNITIRGYSVVGDLYLDGMRDAAQYNREVFNLEQIDVLRGSSSMLYGRGSTGGVVNQASKLPKLEPEREASLASGSDGYYRLLTDYNEVVSPTSAARVNAMLTDAQSFREGVETSRWGVAPAYRFGIGEANEGHAAVYYLKDDNVPDMGVPYDPFTHEPIGVPVTRFYGFPDTDREENDTRIVTAGFTHRFAADTQVRTLLRHADYQRQLYASAPRLALATGETAVSDSTVMNRQRQWRGSEEQTITSQTDFTSGFDTGTFGLEMLVGVEILSEQADRWTNGPVGGTNPTGTVGDPNNHPVQAVDYGAQQALRRDPNSYDSLTYGVYAQDLVRFLPSWKLLLGARYDRSNADYDRSTAGDLARTEAVWSWRTGLLFQPLDTHTYYVSYGTSYNPSAELYQLDDRGANTPPERNRNLEAGAKWLLLDQDLALRAAVARSEKTHERNTDLSVSTTANLLSGRRHTDSLELEAVGRLTDAWELSGAVALLRARIDEGAGTALTTVGRTPQNTPDYTSSIWTTYRFMPGWKAGGGVEAVGERFANNTNERWVPAYVRYDLMAAYETHRYEVQLNVLNALDEDYYEGVYQGHAVPGTLRAAMLKVGFKL